MFGSLASQEALPRQVIVVDASEDGASRAVTERFAAAGGRECQVEWHRAAAVGAARQRNQGVALAHQPLVAFFDDDILFEPACLGRLYAALISEPRRGGVNAMITNQRYAPPGHISRAMFRLMAGGPRQTYAGCLLGPAVNLLPEDRDDLPDVVPVEWLNTTCTLYRRAALPDPPFPEFFTGYSLMEDVALSARVRRNWQLANVRTARIFHDSRPGAHKDDPVAVARMELVNRHYVMTEILGRHAPRDRLRLAAWEAYQIAICALQHHFGASFRSMLLGKWLGLGDLLRRRAPGRR